MYLLSHTLRALLTAAPEPVFKMAPAVSKRSDMSLRWVVGRWEDWTLTASVKSQLIIPDAFRSPDPKFIGWLKAEDNLGPYTWLAFRYNALQGNYQRAIVSPRGFLPDEIYRKEPPQGPYQFND